MALGFAALLLFSVRAGGSVGTDEGKSYLVKAYFNNVGNLKVDSPVKSALVLEQLIGEFLYRSATQGGE